MNPIAARVLLALLCSSWASLGAARPPHKAAEVQVPCGNLFGVGPPAPLRNLCKALKQHPEARLFRVRWEISASMGVDSCAALYDRQRHTLKLVDHQRWSIEEKKSVELHQLLEEWLFSRVDDAKLRHLNQKYARRYDGEDASLAHFPRLRELGCKRRQLRHVALSHREKL